MYWPNGFELAFAVTTAAITTAAVATAAVAASAQPGVEHRLPVGTNGVRRPFWQLLLLK